MRLHLVDSAKVWIVLTLLLLLLPHFNKPRTVKKKTLKISKDENVIKVQGQVTATLGVVPLAQPARLPQKVKTSLRINYMSTRVHQTTSPILFRNLTVQILFSLFSDVFQLFSVKYMHGLPTSPETSLLDSLSKGR